MNNLTKIATLNQAVISVLLIIVGLVLLVLAIKYNATDVGIIASLQLSLGLFLFIKG
jgi:hypothetical protein